MCMLCEQVSGQNYLSSKFNNALSSYRLAISPSELLDNSSLGVTRRAIATDEVLDYYLHEPGGVVTVSGGGLGVQEIQSLVFPESDQDYFNSVVRRLDSIIDLDFRQVDIASNADVDIYYDTEIDLGSGLVVLGLATSNNVGTSGWELYINYPALQNDEPYRRYALIHEFGHSLGLEHPFEARDGDVFNSNTDPWTSAYPEDTVMAYRSPRSGPWPDFFSTNDLNALIEVWGSERQFLSHWGSKFDGNNFNDDVVGGPGADSIAGQAGFDFIAGCAGDDELRGGLNGDEVRGGSGNDQIFGGRGHDTLIGGKGNDVIRGGFGGDLFVYSAGDDVIEDFRICENDRLKLQDCSLCDLQQYGNDLLLTTAFGTIMLSGVDQLQFQSENPVVIS